MTVSTYLSWIHQIICCSGKQIILLYNTIVAIPLDVVKKTLSYLGVSIGQLATMFSVVVVNKHLYYHTVIMIPLDDLYLCL